MPDFDSIVVGGGSGGLAFAQTAAGLGAKVALVEREDLGGTCVNRGCVPKKILWSAGAQVRSTRHAAEAGILTAPELSFETLASRIRDHIDSLRGTFEDDLKDAGVTLVRGEACIDGKIVMVGDQTFTAGSIVIATGARPASLDIDGSKHLSDSRDVLGWTTLPQRIAISGGGYIGCEFAAIYAALGVQVTLIHAGETLLETFPAPLADHVETLLAASGVKIHLNAELSAVTQTDDGLKWTMNDGTSGVSDKVVAAVGRTPNVDTLGPISERLTLAQTGAIAVDAQLQTNLEGVFAIGDAADRLPLTPVATADGTALAHILYGDGQDLIPLDHVATTTFVYPPAAYVGEVDGDTSPETIRPLSDNILSTAKGPDPSYYRLGFDVAGKLTGAEIITEHAEDLISVLSTLRRSGATRPDFNRIIPVHPSFAEEFTGI